VTSGWTGGYLTEIDYKATFQREIAPTNLCLAATIKLVESPPLDRPFNYLELGCGYGLTTTILAAANPNGAFIANDFNPAHIVQARRLAAEAGVDNVRFLEQSFAELLEIDLPEFDFIALHGVLSWVSADNVQNIVELLRRRMKPGGMAYVSYNTMPAWAAIAPVQHLIETMSRHFSGSVIERLGQCIVLAERLKAANARYFVTNPFAARWIDDFRREDPHYLAHEYLSENWTAYYAADVHARMTQAKLTFVGSAAQLENFQDDSQSDEMRQLIRDIPAGPLRELATDFAINRMFRRDVFVRGAVAIDTLEQRRILMGARYALTRARRYCDLEVGVPGGTVRLDEPIIPALLDVLAERPRTLAELIGHPSLATTKTDAIVRALMTLVSVTYAQTCLPPDGEPARRARTDRFNEVAVRRILSGRPLQALASPVLGNGVPIDPIDCFCLAARHAGGDPVDFVLDRLAATDQPVAKGGEPVTDPAVLRGEVADRLARMIADGPPFLGALGITI
jgi:SAM-dependent methyltransferase